MGAHRVHDCTLVGELKCADRNPPLSGTRSTAELITCFALPSVPFPIDLKKLRKVVHRDCLSARIVSYRDARTDRSQQEEGVL